MNFLVADAFTDSLAHLTGDEQKSVKTTAFDLQMDPSAPGLSFHKLEKAKDKRFWSVRVSSDIRLIVHRTNAAVVDEAQDISIAQFRFLAALAGGRPNGVFFAGDLGNVATMHLAKGLEG